MYFLVNLVSMTSNLADTLTEIHLCSAVVVGRLISLQTKPSFEFQLMSNVKTGRVSGSRLATLLRLGEERNEISVDRSGGGV